MSGAGRRQRWKICEPVPADGAPRVSIPLELPAFAEPAAAADAGAGAAATKGAVDAAASVEEVEAS